MRLDTEFYRLPFQFDAVRLAREALAVPGSKWRPHAQGYPGNSALALVSAGGDPAAEAPRGPMAPTGFLAAMPYVRQVLAAFETVLGRTRLMRVAGGAEVTPHADVHHYRFEHVRIHVPVVTFPDVEFTCHGKTLSMRAGEAWILDTWKRHAVRNGSTGSRIHLVIDTVGTARYWDLVGRSERPFDQAAPEPAPDVEVPFDPGREPALEFERTNLPVVMTPWDQELAGGLPLSRHTLTPPAPDEWKKNAADLEPILPRLEATAARARALLARPVEAAPAMTTPQPAEAPLASVHTSTFTTLLERLRISVLVSTYQAGKLIVLRADGARVNTHFRDFQVPMGLAWDGRRLAIGCKNRVWELHDVPAVAAKIEPPGKHDACLLPRTCHFTGDVDVHELAWGATDLWFVNTRFSCLSTLDRNFSFVPRWRPPFVSALSPEDRCHLNGLGLVDGQPRYVTALGRTDANEAWRKDKARGGCLLEVPSGRVVASGLSMPHSPRWHGGQLFLLESGEGALSHVDLASGAVRPIAKLPGFTRGLDFVGQFAFVGLSQVRESAMFSGIPITERAAERNCGVWVVDVTNGQAVAFLRFESGVQEIFAVQVLPRIRYPEVFNEAEETHLAGCYVLPDAALAEVAFTKPPPA